MNEYVSRAVEALEAAVNDPAMAIAIYPNATRYAIRALNAYPKCLKALVIGEVSSAETNRCLGDYRISTPLEFLRKAAEVAAERGMPQQTRELVTEVGGAVIGKRNSQEVFSRMYGDYICEGCKLGE